MKVWIPSLLLQVVAGGGCHGSGTGTVKPQNYYKCSHDMNGRWLTFRNIRFTAENAYKSCCGTKMHWSIRVKCDGKEYFEPNGGKSCYYVHDNERVSHTFTRPFTCKDEFELAFRNDGSECGEDEADIQLRDRDYDWDVVSGAMNLLEHPNATIVADDIELLSPAEDKKVLATTQPVRSTKYTTMFGVVGALAMTSMVVLARRRSKIQAHCDELELANDLGGQDKSSQISGTERC